jgi:hypothetical protein
MHVLKGHNETYFLKFARKFNKRWFGRRVIEEVNMVKVHYMHVWKYHNETPHTVQLTCTNKKKK